PAATCAARLPDRPAVLTVGADREKLCAAVAAAAPGACETAAARALRRFHGRLPRVARPEVVCEDRASRAGTDGRGRSVAARRALRSAPQAARAGRRPRNGTIDVDIEGRRATAGRGWRATAGGRRCRPQ